MFADPGWLLAAALCLYVLVLAVPGALVGAAAGLRGWTLAGLTPLLGYAVLGLAGPWLHITGLPFTVASAVAATLATAALIFGFRYADSRWRAEGRLRYTTGTEGVLRHALPGWSRRAHLAVAGCVAAAFAISIIVLIGAAEGVPDAIFQRWDPVFHANGIRYITETGDGGVYGVSSVNRYGPNGSLFYPNAYHLAGSLVHTLTGASIPVVLNGITMPLAGIFALSLAALVRECGGRAVLAGSAAIIGAATTSAIHESVANGLVPFALSIALTPLAAVALNRYLVEPDVGTGIVLTLAAAGLLAVHSSALFAGILFAVPLLVQRWRRDSGVLMGDLARLAPVAVLGALIAAPHLLGAIDHTGSGYSYEAEAAKRASDFTVPESVGNVLLFWHGRLSPQFMLAGLLVIGLLTFRRLGDLRWIVGAAAVFGLFSVLVASYGTVDWVATVSRPWWNDRFRLVALAAIPLCVLAAHGLAETQRWVTRVAASRFGWVHDHPRGATVAGLSTGVLVVALLGAVTNGFYTKDNTAKVAHAFHNKLEDKLGISQPITVSAYEHEAMRAMAEIAEPGERVLNERTDGSVWMYALTGVKSVAGHFDANIPPPDAAYLAEHFRRYPADPKVRAAVQRLNVRHVFIGSGWWRGEERAPGLADLDEVDFLREVYRNPDAVIYEITS